MSLNLRTLVDTDLLTIITYYSIQLKNSFILMHVILRYMRITITDKVEGNQSVWGHQWHRVAKKQSGDRYNDVNM